MARRRKVIVCNRFIHENQFVVSPTLTISKGDIIKIKGEHGLKFRFHSLVTNPETGTQWVDCFELEKSGQDRTLHSRAWRSFYPDRVVVPPKKRTKRGNN